MPIQPKGPDLRTYMDKRLNVKLNANRRVAGVLKGYDPFMNLVLEDAEEFENEDTVIALGTIVIRGNSVIQMECLDRT